MDEKPKVSLLVEYKEAGRSRWSVAEWVTAAVILIVFMIALLSK